MKFKNGDKIMLDKVVFEIKQNLLKSKGSRYVGTKGDFSIKEVIEVDFLTKEYKIKTKFGIGTMTFQNDYLCRLATQKEIKKDQLKKMFIQKVNEELY